MAPPQADTPGRCTFSRLLCLDTARDPPTGNTQATKEDRHLSQCVQQSGAPGPCAATVLKCAATHSPAY